MSSTTSSAADASSSTATALPTTTTFLPILDDLLSPDFRPVTLPPIVTPLQTPTTNVSNNTASGGGGIPPQQQQQVNKVGSESDAATKIQKWWKRNKNGGGGDNEDQDTVKHKIRHKRTEEYIRHLESELTRLKQTLTAERKLRSLQFEAIRSLWSQVQKITANNIDQPLMLMTQSLPNGLPLDTQQQQQPAPPPPVAPCTCSTEITTLKQKLEEEMGELRKLVNQLITANKEQEASCSSSRVNKRPDTLDLGGGGNGKHGELQGYADSVAKSVVVAGVSSSSGEVNAAAAGGGGQDTD